MPNRMNAQEELELPPWEKFRLYGLFPYKMVLHLTLIGLVTSSIIISNTVFSGYSRSIWSSILNIMFPNDYTDFQSDLTSPYQYFIYTQNQTINDANKLIDSYFNLPKLSLNDLEIYNINISSLSNPVITVQSGSGTESYDVYDSTSDWPLSYSSLDSLDQRTFFNDLRKMDFRFYFKSYGYDRSLVQGKSMCFDWKLFVGYDLTSAGQILVTGRPTVLGSCDGLSQRETMYVIAAIMLFLSLLFQALLLKAICKQLIILHAVRQQSRQYYYSVHSERQASVMHGLNREEELNSPIPSNDNDATVLHPVSSDGPRVSNEWGRPSLATLREEVRMLRGAVKSLTWKDIFRIVNIWFFISSLGNLFCLLACAQMTFSFQDFNSSAYLKAMIGVSCLMYWFSLAQYLEFFPRYYVMISMLKITAPRVSSFLLGVLPFFIGYALLGMICFADVSDRFSDITDTLRTLFSVVNGDIIYDTFNSIDYFAGLGGQLYLYLYILLFTYVVLMTIIAIVEEAFFEAQTRKYEKSKSTKAEATGEESKSNVNSVDDKGPEPNSDSPAALTRKSTLGKRNLPEHLRILLQNVDRQKQTY